ncbi:MAG: molybdate ABC transporter substrate-binding protein [Gammaproteobacteria bacterium]|nr:molybdate ABC transporter substrate-binding protein [Gammaproteobacteria bacterium]
MPKRCTYPGTLLALLLVFPVHADTVNVAVASNFAETLRRLAPLFSRQSGHQIKISAASTGKLYAQILHGAPFDVFLAADQERPKRLVEANRADAGTLTTYALGQLVLWQPKAAWSEADGSRLLLEGEGGTLAIANPTTAPYGTAAQEALEALGVWSKFQDRIVRGENIGQTFHFVASGAADFGLVAYSQILNWERAKGFVWRVPHNLHSPIRQQGVVVGNGSGRLAAVAFMKFLTSTEAAQIIARDGYLIEGKPE